MSNYLCCWLSPLFWNFFKFFNLHFSWCCHRQIKHLLNFIHIMFNWFVCSIFWLKLSIFLKCVSCFLSWSLEEIGARLYSRSIFWFISVTFRSDEFTKATFLFFRACLSATTVDLVIFSFILFDLRALYHPVKSPKS
jgi:hypothetical protein